MPDSTNTPRTWTLSEKRQPWSSGFDSTVRVKPEDECSFTDEMLTRVIEAEPVLDLLQGALDQKAMPDESFDPLIETLLRSHGRLQDGGSYIAIDELEGQVNEQGILEVRKAMTTLGQAWRGSWADFDGRTLRTQLDELDALFGRAVSGEDMAAPVAAYLSAWGICPDCCCWTEYCAHSNTPVEGQQYGAGMYRDWVEERCGGCGLRKSKCDCPDAR